MTRASALLFGLALASSLAACGGHEFEPPDRGERVREAAAGYSPALFDTVAWGSEEERSAQGNQVYVDKCRRCHGPLGEGGTDYARERKLEVPSLVEPEWALAAEDSLHRVVYVGHEDGMPIYGDGGISPREIDAVADYILNVLRPDVLRSAGSAGH
jgi:mono/diheme cytochrome c family protein